MYVCTYVCMRMYVCMYVSILLRLPHHKLNTWLCMIKALGYTHTCPVLYSPVFNMKTDNNITEYGSIILLQPVNKYVYNLGG